MAINQEKKSNRLLGSRRFTSADLNTSQEAFQSNIDIQASEVYTQANLIPTSSLPFSGSSQNGNIHQVDSKNVVKYYYRQRLTKSNVANDVFFFMNPTGSNNGVTPQLIQNGQQTSFVSPKYSLSTLANANTEDGTPGYGVKVFKSTSTNSGSLGDSDIVSANDYQFDFKTGVLQFESALNSNDIVYMTAYQYVGETLQDSGAGGTTVTANPGSSGGGSLTTITIGETSYGIAGAGLSAAAVSGSLGANATLIRSLTAAGISGSTQLPSGLISGSGQLPSGTVSGSGQINDLINDTIAATIVGEIDNDEIPIAKLAEDSITIAGNATALGGSITSATILEGTTVISGSTSSPTFAGLTSTGDVTVQGKLTANEYIVSSSITTMSIAQSSGSTIFGDTLSDTHRVTGSMLVTGSVSAVSFIGDGSQLTNLPSADVVDDTSPQLGGDLDLNSQNITGTGNVAITGSVSLDTQAFKYGVTTWKEAAGVNEFSGSSWSFKADKGSGDLFDFRDNNNNLVFKATHDKMLVFGAVTGTTPTPVAGGLIYSGSDEWFLGYENDPT